MSRLKKDKQRKRHSFRWINLLITAFVFVVILVTMLIVIGIEYLLLHYDILKTDDVVTGVSLSMLLLASTIIGTVITFGVTFFLLKPVKTAIRGLYQLADGKYDTRINTYQVPILQEYVESFNTLAEELQNTEMLRSDFVNNFSHEFKTPIVSIRGFARLLQKGNLSAEKQQEYLDIIVSESTRLAAMATNVLNLTKIENQNILSRIESFNLSEQLRTCILLLSDKWEEKQLTIEADFEEVFCSGNQELLQQVWINLIDNAIKFAAFCGIVAVDVHKEESCVVVTVCDTGVQIPQEAQKYIFDKFYQADTSHATAGNGVGLAIVAKVVALHKGSVRVESSPELTSFIVSLPQ